MARQEHFDTLTDLWHKTVRGMWGGTIENGGIDFVASIDTIRYGNLLQAKSMAYEFDLGRDLWLTKHRWTVLVRQYLEASEVDRFLDGAGSIGLKEGRRGVVTSMFCRNVARESKKHRWGNCMATFNYRGHGRRGQPTLSMHSRVSYIAYIGGLDLALAHVLAREIGERIDVPVEDFAFEWYIDALQFHGFKSLPMLYKQQYIRELESEGLREQYPTISLVGRWYDTILGYEGMDLEEIKYGPLRRVTRRWREYQAKDFQPSIPVSQLTLDPLYRR